MFERPGGGERALLVHLRLQKLGDNQLDYGDFEFKDRQREFEELCLSAGCEIIECVTSQRYAPDPKSYMGKGKVEEVRQLVIDQDQVGQLG